MRKNIGLTLNIARYKTRNTLYIRIKNNDPDKKHKYRNINCGNANLFESWNKALSLYLELTKKKINHRMKEYFEEEREKIEKDFIRYSNIVENVNFISHEEDIIRGLKQ